MSGGRHYAPGCGGGRWPAVPILAADVVKVVVRPHLQETRVDRRRRSVWVEGEVRPHRADQPHLVPPRQRDDALHVPAAVHLCTARGVKRRCAHVCSASPSQQPSTT